MKILNFILLLGTLNLLMAQEPNVDPIAYELSRSLARDLFELNGVDIMQPSVEVINATSNDRFFYTAKVKNDDKFHYRFSLNFMTGIVPESKKSFTPQLPQEQFDLAKLTQYITINPFNGTFSINDTTQLVNYIFKTLIYDGIQDKSIVVPDKAATLLGKSDARLEIGEGNLERLARARFDSLSGGLFQIPQDIEDQIVNTLNSVPSSFPLVPGGNINTLFAGVPQFDIMYNGFELNLRYIPKLDYGEEFGKFGFYGIGLKYMLSKHFYKKENDQNWRVALQFALQGTNLENEIGVTQAKLKSDANLMNFNIHASKMVKDWFEVFSGFSFENLDIETSYEYTLPIEVQWELNLIEEGKHEPNPPQYPGDQLPQTYTLKLNNQNFKWTIGLNKSIGIVDLFASFSLSRFNIFTFGIATNF